MMKKLLTFCIFLSFGFFAIAQQRKDDDMHKMRKNKIDHVAPLFWWVGMQNDSLQVMLHGSHLGHADVDITYPGIHLEKIHRVANKHYLFLDLFISSQTKAGKVPIHLHWKDGEADTLYYVLKEKNKSEGKKRAQGISARDFIYLLMPDRFADGDPSNDRVRGMRDQSLNRDSLTARHGGDIQGVVDHLDYFNRLGVTALWLTPVIENDQKEGSYHGYAFTDNYQVDPRLGSNASYKTFVDSAHAHHLKVIQDIVLNHAGSENWIVKDLPMKDWLNQWPEYTNSSYRSAPLYDPHGSQFDKKHSSKGWFVPSMPDLNQRNPYVAKYLIQNAIWWVEYAGIDAFRIDTYFYSDLHFLNHFNAALLAEFPQLFIFGETWVHGVAAQAYFTRNNFTTPFRSNLPGETDFQLQFAIRDALTQETGWTTGMNRLYLTLSEDFVYENPLNNVVFIDNHDMSRFLSMVGDNVEKLKSGFAWMLTTRGIPQMYYGDEILMKNFSDPDGLVREDFPGGWKEDEKNKFMASGRSKAENNMFNFVRTLAHYRQTSTALQTGKLMQFLPEDGIYVYFRYDEESTVMILMNGKDKKVEVKTNRYGERMQGYTTAENIITGKKYHDLSDISLRANETLVLELQK